MIYDLKRSILILHGWGLRGSIYAKLLGFLKKEGYSVYAPDLPGFGAEPLKKTMNLDDYVSFVHDFIVRKKMKKVILIGHSFGGRVAIKYAWKYPYHVSRLVLTGVPIIRKKSIKKQFVFIAAIVGGKFFSLFPVKIKEFFRKSLYFMIGEWDYYKSGPLKQVFKNIIGEDVVQYVQKIKIPTLLIWGDNDRLVSVSTIVKIKNHIPHAEVVIVPNNGHKLPYENAALFFGKVLPFIK